MLTSSRVAHHSTSTPPLADGDSKSAPAFSGVVRREDIKGTWHKRLCWVGATAAGIGPLYNVMDTLSDTDLAPGATAAFSLFSVGLGAVAGSGTVHACYRMIDKVNEWLERRTLSSRVMSPQDQLAHLVEQANKQALNTSGLTRRVDDICRLQATFPESITGEAAADAIVQLTKGAFQPTLAENRCETRGDNVTHLEVKALCRGLEKLLGNKVISPEEHCSRVVQLASRIASSRNGHPTQMKLIAGHLYAALTQTGIPEETQLKYLLQISNIRAFSEPVRTARGAESSRATMRSDEEDGTPEISVIVGEQETHSVVQPGDEADGPVERDRKYSN